MKALFDGYCKNYVDIYDGKYLWTNKEGLTWSTHSILKFFRGLGESSGFDTAMNKQEIGGVSLSGKGDLFWIKNQEPVLHLESENTRSFGEVTEELEKLGSSDIPYKVGVFQLDNASLKRKTLKRVRNLLARRRLVKKGTRWLLIFDIWNDTEIEDIEYSYTDPKTNQDISKEYTLEYYPLIGMIPGEKNDNVKLAKVYRLPFDKMGVMPDKWTRLTKEDWL